MLYFRMTGSDKFRREERLKDVPLGPKDDQKWPTGVKGLRISEKGNNSVLLQLFHCIHGYLQIMVLANFVLREHKAWSDREL